MAAFLLKEALTQALVVEEHRASNRTQPGGGSEVRARHADLMAGAELETVPGV